MLLKIFTKIGHKLKKYIDRPNIIYNTPVINYKLCHKLNDKINNKINDKMDVNKTE